MIGAERRLVRYASRHAERHPSTPAPVARCGECSPTSRITIMRSFAHCSSSASTLPSSVEAKPHCGDRQSWSSATYLVASSMRRLMSSLLLQRADLRGDEAEHDDASCPWARSAAARSRRRARCRIRGNSRRGWSCRAAVRRRLVAARRDEGRAEIAAAECMVMVMSAGLPSSAALVMPRIALRQRVRIVAALGRPARARSDRTDTPRRCRRAAGSGSRRRRRRGSPCDRPWPRSSKNASRSG